MPTSIRTLIIVAGLAVGAYFMVAGVHDLGAYGSAIMEGRAVQSSNLWGSY